MKRKVLSGFMGLMFVLALVSFAKADNKENIGKINGKGTAVILKIDGREIPATLNDTTTAKDLISRLPYTISLNRYSHDYCGNPSERLAYDEKDVQSGWRNGEISYEKRTPYFVIFFGDEENSKQHGDQVIIGRVDVDPEVIKEFGRSMDLTIEPAK